MFIEEDLFRYNPDLWKTIWPKGLPEYVKNIKWQNIHKTSFGNKVFINSPPVKVKHNVNKIYNP